MKISSASISTLLIILFLLLFKGTNYGNRVMLYSYSTLVAAKTIGQHEIFWCWAASGEMTMGIDQCRIADSALHPENNCCVRSGELIPLECNKRFTAAPFENFGFTAKKTTRNSPLPWNEIKNQIDNKNPIIGSWRYNGENSDGHQFVVSGYSESGNARSVYVRNPLPVWQGSARWLSYSFYVRGPDTTIAGVNYPSHLHGTDYYNIMK